MKKGDAFYQTRDTRLAAALATVGIGFYEALPFARYVNEKSGKQQIIWHLNQQSDDGKLETSELVKAYHDPFLMKTKDPNLLDFAIAVSSLKNREQLIDALNNADAIVETWQNDELWLVPESKKAILENL